MTTFEQALSLANSELKLGNILKIHTGSSNARGKYIEVETDQGWSPCAFWQEIQEDYDCMSDF